ncbi:MAG: zinc ribbon domain-containing protein [Candidatus Krumholzibacteriota bacterium]|nr:zinc ribbon domain-containing protein [Candidatus Krumholzibacteriota bacterium]
MNCPRCTNDIPEGARYCPSCGLDLDLVRGEPVAEDLAAEAADAAGAPAAAALPPPAEEVAGYAEDAESYWPRQLHLQAVASPKRPFLAATLGFLFGPFTYLYLEQSAWFWWGLLGGLLLVVISRVELLPLLVVGFTLHAYDVAGMLNRHLEDRYHREEETAV